MQNQRWTAIAKDTGAKFVGWEKTLVLTERSEDDLLDAFSMFIKELEVGDFFFKIKDFMDVFLSTLGDLRFGRQICHKFSDLLWLEKYMPRALKTLYIEAELDVFELPAQNTILFRRKEHDLNRVARVICLLIHMGGLAKTGVLNPIPHQAFVSWLNDEPVVPALFNHFKEKEESIFHQSCAFACLQNGSKLDGIARELLIKEVVEGLLPNGLTIEQGQIIDSDMNVAGEHDVILTTSTQKLQIGQGFSFIPHETVECILEVKSTVSSSSLKKALSQLEAFCKKFDNDDFPLLGLIFLGGDMKIEKVQDELEKSDIPIAFAAVLCGGITCRYDLCFPKSTNVVDNGHPYTRLLKPGAFLAVLTLSLAERCSTKSVWRRYLALDDLIFWSEPLSHEETDLAKSVLCLCQKVIQHNAAEMRECALAALAAFKAKFPSSIYLKDLEKCKGRIEAGFN